MAEGLKAQEILENAAGAGVAAHASTHVTGATDEVDGDKLDIDWTPSNYTPSVTPAEADSVDNLTAHLYGVDQELADKIDEDGTVPLTADWDIGDNRAIAADEIKARDAAGLKLYDDGGNGIFVEDGGQVGIGTATPSALLEVGESGGTGGEIRIVSNAGRTGVFEADDAGEFVHIGTESNHTLQIVTNDTLQIRVETGGRVIISNGPLNLATSSTPVSASATGNQGDIAWDSSYIYICTATNTWRRVAHSTW